MEFRQSPPQQPGLGGGMAGPCGLVHLTVFKDFLMCPFWPIRPKMCPKEGHKGCMV